MAFLPSKGVVAGDREGRLCYSKDGGETWHRGYTFGESGSITTIGVSPGVSRDNTVFVGTEKGGVFKSEDGGASFVEASDGLRGKSIRSVALSPGYERDATVYASTWYEAVFCSKDGGKHWEHFKEGITTNKQADSEQYKSPHFRELRISSAFGEDRTMFLAGFDGLFKSVDGGRRWKQLETMPVRLILQIAVGAAAKNTYNLAIATDGGGVYASTGRGERWTVRNRGLKKTTVQSIAFSSNSNKYPILLAASEKDFSVWSEGAGCWKTAPFLDKEGRALSLIKNGLRKIIRKARLSVPKGLNTFYPKPDFIVVSPDFYGDRKIFFGTRYGGVYRSDDGGLSWSAIWMDRQISSLVISPAFSKDATLFASVRSKGIYRTTSGEKTWHAVNTGLEGRFVRPRQKVQSRTTPDLGMADIRLAISPSYEADHTVFAGSSEGFYRTENKGQSWQRVNVLSLGEDPPIQAIAISPKYSEDGTVLVSVKGRGLFGSKDGGRNFLEIGSGLIQQNHCLRCLAFSPSYAIDRTIFGASDEELFLSTDGGETWKLIPRPVRYEDNQEAIRYEGDWQVAHGEEFSASTVRHSEVSGSRAGLTFVGTGITWLGGTGKDHGIARVLIDGEYVAEVDQFGEERRVMMPVYSIESMPSGPHTLDIEVCGSKNPKASGYRVEIDAFDVFP
jgi:photosystem II stability/assembly factor-like uncharacterized protein